MLYSRLSVRSSRASFFAQPPANAVCLSRLSASVYDGEVLIGLGCCKFAGKALCWCRGYEVVISYMGLPHLEKYTRPFSASL